MSEMPVVIDCDDRENSERQQLLALHELRRDLEWFAAAARTAREVHMAVATSQLARELHELIAALDRRVPRVEQVGETAIARDAAALRAKAVQRLAEIGAAEHGESVLA